METRKLENSPAPLPPVGAIPIISPAPSFHFQLTIPSPNIRFAEGDPLW
jgi:hypothetical protein